MDTGEDTSHVLTEEVDEGGEQPIEDTVEESSEAEAPSEQPEPEVGDSKTYTEEDFKAEIEKIKAEEETRRRNLQSELDKQIAERNKRLAEIERQQAEFQFAERAKKTLSDYGDTPETRQMLQREYQSMQMQQQAQANQMVMIDSFMKSTANDLAEKYTPDEATAKEMKAFAKELYEAKPKSPEEMELLAKEKQIQRMMREMQKFTAKQAKPAQEFHVPSSQGSGDGETDFLKRYGDPDYEPTMADHARYYKIQQKRGY